MSTDVSSVFDVLLEAEKNRADKVVFTFVGTNHTDVDAIDYRLLGSRVRSIAATFQDRQLFGRRVVLALPHDATFVYAFYACLAVGAVAVPIPKYRPGRDESRLLSVVADCEPALVLCAQDGLTALQSVLEERGLPTTVEAVENLAGDADSYERPDLRRDTLAVIQYTSGSTGDPKGVMISNGNFLHNCARIKNATRTGSHSTAVTWLPFFHDMGLVGSVLQPVYTDGAVTIMQPQNFLRNPMEWIERLAGTQATITVAPNFAFELVCDRVTDEQIQTLDLSCVEAVLNGSEPINATTLRRFADTFRPCGFRWQAFLPTYGLAESTLMATGALRSKTGPVVQPFYAGQLAGERVAVRIDESTLEQLPASSVTRLVGSGPDDGSVTIVDPDTSMTVPDGQIGEVWLSGNSIAQGYWNKPEATAQCFGQRPVNDAAAEPAYRTGDLGFILDGELYVTGRLKDLIIVRGRNFSPQDIEDTITRSDDLLATGAAAAFSLDRGQGEEVVVVAEVTRSGLKRCREPDIVKNLLRRIREAVSEAHELNLNEIRLLKPRCLSRTTSGKVQRQQVKTLWADEQLNSVTVHSWTRPAAVDIGDDDDSVTVLATREQAQAYLLDKLAATSGMARHEIALDAPFAGYGLDSITAVRLVAEIDKRTPHGMSIEPVALYDYPTVEALLDYLYTPAPHLSEDAEDSDSHRSVEDEAAALRKLLDG